MLTGIVPLKRLLFQVHVYTRLEYYRFGDTLTNEVIVMGRMTIDRLRQKYGTEGIRIIAHHYQEILSDGDITMLQTIDYELVISILTEVGEMLTEEVT
jgi:hypothetical protein